MAAQTRRTNASELHGHTFWSAQPHNPCFSPDDDALPAGHRRRNFQQRRSGFINADLLSPVSSLRQLYDSDVVLHFVWGCLGTERPVYRWADPLGRNPYGVMESGHNLPWHFDGNEFTVSIVAQRCLSGGIFEYVPNIRSPRGENYEQVAHILGGGCGGVRQLDLQPGDLQLFAGRYSMHRVTKIEGETPRYIGLPTYVHDPFRVNRPYHSTSVYGRATPMHHARAHAQVDGLIEGKRALIMRNHGFLTVGETSGEAFMVMHYLVRACRTMLAAHATGLKLDAGAPEVWALHKLFGACRSSVNTYVSSRLWLPTPVGALGAEARPWRRARRSTRGSACRRCWKPVRPMC